MKKAVICFSAAVMVFCLSGIFVFADSNVADDGGKNVEASKDVVVEKAHGDDDSKATEANSMQRKNELGEKEDVAPIKDESLEISDQPEKEQVKSSNEDKTYSPNSWVNLDGNTYYAGADGKLVSGVYSIAGELLL